MVPRDFPTPSPTKSGSESKPYLSELWTWRFGFRTSDVPCACIASATTLELSGERIRQESGWPDSGQGAFGAHRHMAMSAGPAMPSLLRSSSAAGAVQSPLQTRLRALARTQLGGRDLTQRPVAASSNAAVQRLLASAPGRPWPSQSRSLRGLGDRKKPAASTRALASRPIVANWNQVSATSSPGWPVVFLGLSEVASKGPASRSSRSLVPRVPRLSCFALTNDASRPFALANGGPPGSLYWCRR